MSRAGSLCYVRRQPHLYLVMVTAPVCLSVVKWVEFGASLVVPRLVVCSNLVLICIELSLELEGIVCARSPAGRRSLLWDHCSYYRRLFVLYRHVISRKNKHFSFLQRFALRYELSNNCFSTFSLLHPSFLCFGLFYKSLKSGCKTSLEIEFLLDWQDKFCSWWCGLYHSWLLCCGELSKQHRAIY